ncbi:hypothetical protein LL912_18900 [Niabella sp. CC-SYL272]|uniref:hypothetical protein n=1 Tax=Niabella agricola TaxID=2891571 RepID=UPI001F1BC858|nr:hypothetical protein [Niabella agricola]MCF3110861.1 hypothetical protein [Niabella agricola]
MRYRFPCSLILSLLFCCVLQAQQLSFSPMRLFFKGAPGETVSETITISNTTSQSYEFLLSLKDWNRDSLGIKHYFPVSSLPHSNAKNIKLPQTSFVVAPGEKKTYTVSMRIPIADTQKIASNSMLFFTQVNAPRNETGDKSGIGIRISMEFGIQLFYTPQAAQKGTLRFLAFNYEPGHKKDSAGHRLVVKYQNTGQVHKDGFIRFELTNKQTGEEIKPEPVPIAIMPGDDQVVHYPLPKLAAGNYLAVAILDAGSDNELKVAEKNMHVEE